MTQKSQEVELGVYGMESPPENELGVVCLFTLMHRRLGFKRIRRIQTRFPDCVAIRRDGSSEREVRIEFEFRSGDFRRHGHSARRCDCIVCWEHDWIDTPKRLEGNVIDLRKFVGMGRDVWMQPIGKEYWEWHDQTREKTGRWWGPPPTVKKGDLVIWYCTSPRSHIDQVCLVTSDPAPDQDARRSSHGRWLHSVDIKVLARMQNPISYHEMRTNRNLLGSPFLRGNLRHVFRITPSWPTVHQMIVAKNASLRQELERFAPERL